MPVLEAESTLAQSIQSNAKGEAQSIKDIMLGRSDVYKLNPFDIVIEPGFNARDVNSPGTLEHIDGLAKSIANFGLQRPLKVRMKGNRPVLRDGECRLRAVKRAIEVYGAEIRTVDCLLASKGMSDADDILSLVVENSGRDLNALEKSDVFKRLMSHGWSLNEIADRSGLSTVRVTQLIELAAVPEAVKVMIRNDEIAPTLAWQVAKEEGFDSERTLERITNARETAVKTGKKRVTARFAKGTKTSFRTSLADCLDGCVVEDMEDDGFVVIFTREKFEALRELSKFDFNIASCFFEADKRGTTEE